MWTVINRTITVLYLPVYISTCTQDYLSLCRIYSGAFKYWNVMSWVGFNFFISKILQSRVPGKNSFLGTFHLIFFSVKAIKSARVRKEIFVPSWDSMGLNELLSIIGNLIMNRICSSYFITRPNNRSFMKTNRWIEGRNWFTH